LVGVLLAISVLTFLMLNALPGNAAEVRIGPLPNLTPEQRAEVVANLYRQLGLDKPLPIQYGIWLWNAVRGDFGLTVDGTPVSGLVLQRLGPTIELGLASIFFSLLGCVGLAVWAYGTRNRRLYEALQGAMSSMLVVPGFWLGFLLILIFAVELSLLPASGYTAPEKSPAENVRHLLLPAVTLALPQCALFFRYLLAGMEDVAGMPFVLAARAKGIEERAVTYRHVLPNAALPTVTIVGLVVGSMISGLVIVETVFAWPGLGSLLVQSVGRRDYNTLAAVVLLTAAAYVIASISVDISYWWLDPRTRRG
jgi:peptide/nickel transport system permease protein